MHLSGAKGLARVTVSTFDLILSVFVPFHDIDE
jgi:hypothetical protein